MSYREIRNFTERLKILGYPELISYTSFRLPNFPLMSKILVWLIKRYDPTLEVPLEIDSTDSRIAFVKGASQTVALKTKIRLNNRKLYCADGYCVQELLKLVNLLYECEKLALKHSRTHTSSSPQQTATAKTAIGTKNSDGFFWGGSKLQDKLAQIPGCRQLAQEITERGTKLYDLLQQEVDQRDLRGVALARPLDLALFQRDIETQQGHLTSQTTFYQQRMSACQTDCQNLQAKLEKKKSELERCQKRLKSLQAVRPAYLDEYERLEGDLKLLYQAYVNQFRHLAYLEQALEEQDELERERNREVVKDWNRLRKRAKKEQYKWLMDKGGSDEDEEEEDEEDANDDLEGDLEDDLDDMMELEFDEDHHRTPGKNESGGDIARDDDDDDDPEEELDDDANEMDDFDDLDEAEFDFGGDDDIEAIGRDYPIKHRPNRLGTAISAVGSNVAIHNEQMDREDEEEYYRNKGQPNEGGDDDDYDLGNEDEIDFGDDNDINNERIDYTNYSTNSNSSPEKIGDRKALESGRPLAAGRRVLYGSVDGPDSGDETSYQPKQQPQPQKPPSNSDWRARSSATKSARPPSAGNRRAPTGGGTGRVSVSEDHDEF